MAWVQFATPEAAQRAMDLSGACYACCAQRALIHGMLPLAARACPACVSVVPICVQSSLHLLIVRAYSLQGHYGRGTHHPGVVAWVGSQQLWRRHLLLTYSRGSVHPCFNPIEQQLPLLPDPLPLLQGQASCSAPLQWFPRSPQQPRPPPPACSSARSPTRRRSPPPSSPCQCRWCRRGLTCRPSGGVWGAAAKAWCMCGRPRDFEACLRSES